MNIYEKTNKNAHTQESMKKHMFLTRCLVQTGFGVGSESHYPCCGWGRELSRALLAHGSKSHYLCLGWAGGGKSHHMHWARGGLGQVTYLRMLLMETYFNPSHYNSTHFNYIQRHFTTF